MLGFDEGEEVFFDAAESFSSGTCLDREKLVSSDALGYDIWLKELQSVKERREIFLSKMGFAEGATQRALECGGAVTSSFTSSSAEETLASDCRESNGEANCMVEESALEWSDNVSIWTEEEPSESPCCIGDVEVSQKEGQVEDHKNGDVKKKKLKGWLNAFMHKLKKSEGNEASKAGKVGNEAGKITAMKVRQKKKKFMEFTAVYAGQEINGHSGLISTMKFSPDGQYIASGGEDGIVRVWRVSLTEAVCNLGSESTKYGSSFRKKKKSVSASVVVPDKVFHINESPIHEFHGHSGDILDLAWSAASNQILSASKDNTVRLWQVGSDNCLSVFLHTNYVTCVQFNPVDDNYFISGSVDGKVRIWEVTEKRVVDWASTRDVVSAVCYQPNGKGFVAGFVSGICRFYELHGTEPFQREEMHIGGRKKSSGNRITGIQFLDNDSNRIMITCEDSKIRILDGHDVVHKYQAPTKSASQTSASFTSNGQHIVSVGDDSRVYVWNYDNQQIQSSKAKRCARSCEYFFSQSATVAVPWSGIGTEKLSPLSDSDGCLLTNRHKDQGARDEDRFSLASWFSMDVSAKGRVTWPEEKLPIWELPSPEQNNQTSESSDDHGDLPQQLQHKNNNKNCGNFSATWGTVIITAGWDGKIRTFHNFGLPVKV